MLAIVGIVVSATAALIVRKARNLQLAQDWPVVEGRIVHIGDPHEDGGIFKVPITYTYSVRDERYAGTESLSFRQDEDAARFRTAYTDGTINVHYRPDNPEISAPDLQGSS